MSILYREKTADGLGPAFALCDRHRPRKNSKKIVSTEVQTRMKCRECAKEEAEKASETVSYEAVAAYQASVLPIVMPMLGRSNVAPEDLQAAGGLFFGFCTACHIDGISPEEAANNLYKAFFEVWSVKK